MQVFAKIYRGVMQFTRRKRAPHVTGLRLVFSVPGGLVGFAIGAFLFGLAEPCISSWGYETSFDTLILRFEQWGFRAVLVAGLSPVPYQVFTIAAGVLSLSILTFLCTSIIGRVFLPWPGVWQDLGRQLNPGRSSISNILDRPSLLHGC